MGGGGWLMPFPHALHALDPSLQPLLLSPSLFPGVTAVEIGTMLATPLHPTL